MYAYLVWREGFACPGPDPDADDWYVREVYAAAVERGEDEPETAPS